MLLRLAGLVVLFAAQSATAHAQQCRNLELSFAPASSGPDRNALPQIVAWLEDTAGNYIDTVYITHATGTFGIGNRPGRYDFNSAPLWPYGRRISTFPIWAHKHGLSWPELVFQDSNDDGLSHSVSQSSRDTYFCRPLQGEEMDAMTCPSAISLTDKGVFSANTSRYPPRNDLTRLGPDGGDVDMFAMLNPFDVVSQPTPLFGVDPRASYEISPDLPAGEYVLWVEVSKEVDMNGDYNELVYPPPVVNFSMYGEPYRGQPSVVYRVPIDLRALPSQGTAENYFGYGAPEGEDGAIRPPDGTISMATGSGGARLALLSDGGTMYRVRVSAGEEPDATPPDSPSSVNLVDVTAGSATLQLVAPGDDGLVGSVKGYEVRYLVGETITEANFDGARLVTTQDAIVGPGELQTITIEGLLPETEYSVGIRAFDNCRNAAPLVVIPVTTDNRAQGSVDACFVATAAYGSELAGDVDMLRRFRDAMLRKTVLGELAVEAYYTFGPSAAGVIGESDLLRATARRALAPIVSRAREASW
jgi:hypothetical protein